MCVWWFGGVGGGVLVGVGDGGVGLWYMGFLN